MKPLLVFLHGLGSGHHAFAELRAALHDLESACEFFAPDLIGFGAKPIPEMLTRLSLAAMADEVAKELKALSTAGPRPVHLIAHSMGGAVVLLLQRRHPSLSIESFVNLEGNLINVPSSTSVKVSQGSREDFCRDGFSKLVLATRIAASHDDRSAQDWLIGLKQTSAEAFYDASTDLVRVTESAYSAYRAFPAGEFTCSAREPSRALARFIRD